MKFVFGFPAFAKFLRTKRFSFWSCLSVTLITIISCVEEEPVESFAQPHTKRLVIDGMITSEYKPQLVRLNFSSGYDLANVTPEPASGAQVLISDGASLFVLTETEVGIYATDSISGVPGRSYTVTIELDGARYQGSDTMIPILAHEPLTFVEEADHFEFPYRPHLFGFDFPNRYDLVFFKQDSAEVPNGATRSERTLYTHPKLEPNGVFQFVATDHLRFSGSDWYVKQRKYSISYEYYEFLRAVFSETDWRGSLLDTTPGNVPSNISNDAVGFFSACDVSTLIYPYPTK